MVNSEETLVIPVRVNGIEGVAAHPGVGQRYVAGNQVCGDVIKVCGRNHGGQNPRPMHGYDSQGSRYQQCDGMRNSA
jgi:hypothetical protein